MPKKIQRKMITLDDLEFYDTGERGRYNFDGIPCPTNIAWEILGRKGVNLIHKKMQIELERVQEEVNIRKKKMLPIILSTNEGLKHKEIITDTVNKVRFLVGRPIDYVERSVMLTSKNYLKDFWKLPVHVPKDFHEKYYKRLKNTPHYTIIPWERLPNSEAPEFTEFYGND